MRKITLSLLGVFMSSITLAATVDLSKSSMTWYGDKITGHHYGTIQLGKGALSITNSLLSGGEFSVDMSSIKCGDCDKKSAPKLEGHLKSADFFGVVDGHKTATFKIKTVTAWAKLPAKKRKQLEARLKKVNKRKFTTIKVENPTHLLSGDLTIKGMSHPQDVIANVQVKGARVSANGFMLVDRTRWNVKYGSGKFFENLGDKTISDNFEVAIKLQTK